MAQLMLVVDLNLSNDGKVQKKDYRKGWAIPVSSEFASTVERRSRKANGSD